MKNGSFTTILSDSDLTRGEKYPRNDILGMMGLEGNYTFELLLNNQTISSDVYCRQLDKLDAAIKQKRPELMNSKGFVFHHDNARPHRSLVTRQKLLQLEWDVLPHPPYSPDLVPFFERCELRFS